MILVSLYSGNMVDRRTCLSKQINGGSQTILGRLANDNKEVNPRLCCMYFVSFAEDVLDGSGAEWIPCPCGRWLHENCAEVRDKNEKELYCPMYVDILFVHARTCVHNFLTNGYIIKIIELQY